MSTRRLEEILEECLSAYLEGRRSIAESLSLYPSVADQLEPLLRTATSISANFGDYVPPQHIQQRGLHRFLSDARVRRNLKTLKVSGSERGRFGIAWQKYRVGFAGAAMALVVMAGAVGGSVLVGGSSGGDGNVQHVTTAPSTPAAVINFNKVLDDIKTRSARGENLAPSDIENLGRAASQIQNSPDDEIQPFSDQIAQQLADANSLISDIVVNQPEVAPQAQEAQETIYQVAAVIGAPLPTPTGIAAATPVTTTPEPTPVITEEPTIAPTPEVTPPPTDAPTPTLPPPPSDTPPPREPAGS